MGIYLLRRESEEGRNVRKMYVWSPRFPQRAALYNAYIVVLESKHKGKPSSCRSQKHSRGVALNLIRTNSPWAFKSLLSNVVIKTHNKHTG